MNILLFVALGVGAVVLALVLVTSQMARVEERLERLRRDGVPARVTVRAFAPTTTRINKQPVVEVELDVEAPQGHARVVRRRFVIEALAAGRLAVGQQLEAKLSPDDPDAILVDAWTPPGPPIDPTYGA